MFEELTIRSYKEKLLNGEITTVELTQWYLDRIASLSQQGPELNAVVTVAKDAVDVAEETDRYLAQTGRFLGPLHGVPILVKDQAETAGLRTTFGSKLFEDYVPSADATIVRKLKDAGAVLLGKTAMCDFAAGWFSSSSMTGHTKSPYALDRDSGGSSAGSGSAVAANLCMVAVGEDTGGSIRIPASFNNIVGLRPTTGLVSRTGFSPLVHFQDTPGPLARTVEDAARLLDVLTGFDSTDEYTSLTTATADIGHYADSLHDAPPLDELRLGVLETAFGEDAPDTIPVNTVIRNALKRIEDSGAEVVQGLSLDNLAEWLSETSLYSEISSSDLTEFLAARNHNGINSFEQIYESGVFQKENDLFHDIIGAPKNIEGNAKYLQGRIRQGAMRRQILSLMAEAEVDALVFPNVQVTSPTFNDLDAGKCGALTFPTNTVIGSQTILPAMSIPAGFTQGGLPVGLEILSAPLSEKKLLQIAFRITELLEARNAPKLPAILPSGK